MIPCWKRLGLEFVDRPRAATTFSTILILAGAVMSAAAQSPTIQAASVGDCHITVNVPSLDAQVLVDVQLNRHPLAQQTVGPVETSIRVVLNGPLQTHDQIRARIAGGSWATLEASPGTPNTQAECTAPGTVARDPRGDFEASGYYGRAFDNFAPSRIGNYLNPDSATAGIKSRWLAGTHVEYRLIGRDFSTLQFWLETETLHGVRTGDIDCTKTESPLCSGYDPHGKFLAVLEGASTLELFIEPRLEVYTIHADSDFPVRVFVSGRVGFIDLDTGPKVFRNDQVGLGLLAIAGPFAGSSAEVGLGRTGVIDSADRWNRLKVDARLWFDLVPGWAQRVNVFKRMAAATRGFVELKVDKNPGGHAPDSVQTFVGTAFDFRTAFAK